MLPYCNFDSKEYYHSDPEKSDCIETCKSFCFYDQPGDGICKEECNKPSCGFDFGNCGYCAPSCNQYLGFQWQLGGTCDPECNTTSCYYDYGACLDCAIDCKSNIWGDGNCDEECNNKECNFDNGDCLNVTCAAGCYKWMIGNSICDEACYVEECNFDDYDCDCSPGCDSSLLENGECNEVCNNDACDYDKGDCGYCARGCFLDMLMNDVCDDICNTFRCKYDYYACKCTDGCLAEDYGKCKPECLVVDCKYDQISKDTQKWCNNTELVKYSFYQQIMTIDFDSPVSFDRCLEASSQCSLAMSLDSESCYPECYYKECNFGLCNFTYECMERNNPDFWELCMPCEGYIWEGECYTLGKTQSVFIFGIGVRYPSKLLAAGYPDFSIFYATSTQAGDQSSGDGSADYPYETLDYALSSMYKLQKRTSFLYLADDGDYYLNDCSAFRDGGIHFVIKGYEGGKATIKVNGWSKFTCFIMGGATFENIIFDGSRQYITCSDSEYCEYCSYSTYNESDGNYYNDRNQNISQNLPIQDCINNQGSSLSLFLMSQCTLTLKNVEIKNFRYNYDHIISGDKLLRLLNVSFDNIQLNGMESSAVIYMDIPEPDGFLQITYKEGSVTRLNNGYEIDDPIDFRGFLYVSHSISVLIKDVEFKYNLVSRKPKSTLASASLIYLKTIKDIEIDNCTFIYNYCETGIFYAKLEVSEYETIFNETNYLTFLTLPHINIHDSRFISNFGIFGIIHIEFLYKLLNINLINTTFESNGAESDSLLYIYNPAIIDEYKNETTINIINSGQGEQLIILLPRWCKMTSLTFLDNHALSLINTTNLVNLDIEGLNIEFNGSPTDDKNANTLLFNYFIENRDINKLYISSMKPDPNPIDCNFMVLIESPYNFKLREITLVNNICRNSSPTFKIVNSNIRDLDLINCSGNIGHGQLPVCLYFIGLFDRNIKNSNFSENINYHASGNGVIKIEGENNLYITNCLFFNNSASLAPLYLSGKSLYIEFSTFESNESIYGKGAGLYFILVDEETSASVIISSSYFNSNSANSNGGGIYIEQKSTSAMKLALMIFQTIFTGNKAKYGSAMHIDSSIILTKDSAIVSSKFIENESTISGAISLYYYSGILSFLSCDFIENTSLKMGAAFHIDISQDTQNSRSKVIIESSIFRNNIGKYIIYADSQNRNSSIETKNCLYEYNSGVLVSLDNDFFIDNGSVFQYNSAPFGSCFNLQNSAILYASSQFLNNTSYKYGGVITMSFKSIFNCDSCIFSQNSAIGGKGGVLVSEQDSEFFISNSSFDENFSGNDGSTIFTFNCNSATSSIVNSIFFRNRASGAGVVTFINSKISIVDSTFKENSNDGLTSGIKLTSTNAKISNSKFLNQSSISGNFIYAIADSNVEIQNTSFSNGNSEDSGGAIFSSASLMSINSSVFTNLSSQKGGAIYSVFESTLIINNSEFSDLKASVIGGIINANQASLIIENSNFDEFSLTGIYGKEMKKLNIANSGFSNGFGSNGGAVYCESCNKITINQSKFNNNSAALYGGALFFTTINEIKQVQNISSCKFSNNSAQNGGAINSIDVNLHVSLSGFEQNKAASKQENLNYGNGGGIWISCPNIQTCKFKIHSNNFVENTAKYNGGAISWDNTLPEFINNSYKNNAAEYGENIASYPIKLMQANKDGSLEGYKSRILADFTSNSSLTEIASGQNIKNKLLVALVDNMNNIIRTDNTSEAELKSTNLTAQVSGKIKAIANKGIFNFSDFVISEEPGTDIQIIVTSSAIDINKIKKSGETIFSKSLIFDVKIRECEIGEVKSGKNCEVCPIGFYSLNPELISCLSCPDVAECYGNYTIVPKPGYWRDNMYTDKFWKCPHSPACLGSPDKNNISLTGECEKAYKGNKCQSCLIGYVHTVENKCEECPDTAYNILTITGITFGLMIISFAIVKTTREAAFRPKSVISIYLKIFFNYTQMIILASNFKMSWPEEVIKLFLVQLKSDYVYQEIYSLSCLFQGENSQDLAYFRTLIVVAVIPVSMIILSLSFWAIFKWIKKAYKNFWDDFISTCIILLFLIHPNIVKTMFASMNCTEINDGEYWLEIDLDIMCWDYDHIFYVLAVSLPSIILWGILLPTICLINLTKNKKKLDNISLRLRYGFLFNGYKEKHFYWEFIILYSKIILICCSVFLTRISLILQALIVSILYSIYLHLQYFNNPYNEPNLNQMELRAKCVCAITIYCGLYYLMGSVGYITRYILFILIVSANLYFLIYWAWYLLKEVLAKINKFIRSWINKSRISSQGKESHLNNKDLEDSKNIFSQRENISISSNDNFLWENQILSKDPVEYSQIETRKNFELVSEELSS
ncbi:unnamed protein product [Blepharisma stoltei]|uniref:LNR domain-containing protein n=1 Tax=Blepharisma stoltei TaxID=1481888 RepID=A0AAU9IHE2_9CILI|nr:unnamed protein product [Blepharisma stoltei]